MQRSCFVFSSKICVALNPTAVVSVFVCLCLCEFELSTQLFVLPLKRSARACLIRLLNIHLRLAI